MNDHPTDPDAPPTLKQREELWKLRLTQADFWQKVLISFLGAIVVGIFYLWQASQSESHYYADLQSEREKADNELRGKMFTTLVDQYMKKQPDADKQKPPAASKALQAVDDTDAQLHSIEQHILLSDLLARNFETIDIRPLLEDLDRRLAALAPTGSTSITPRSSRAFELRERLRRVARGTTARQRALLQTVGSQTRRADITSCRTKDGRSELHVDTSPLPPREQSWWSTLATALSKPPEADSKGASGGQREGQGKGEESSAPTAIYYGTSADAADYVEVRAIKDGTVEVKGPYSAQGSQAVNSTFWITYYDMPLLETMRGVNRERVSFGVVRYVSPLTCKLKDTDDSLSDAEKRDLDEFCGAIYRDGKTCEIAEVAITILPADFIASRDRPYLSDLAKRPREIEIRVIVTALFAVVGAALLGFVAFVLWRRLRLLPRAKRSHARG